MTSEEAIQYFNDEIRLCKAAPSINGCEMTDDWKRTIDACDIAVAAIRKVSTLDMAQRERDVVTKRMIELEQEVGRLRAERDALAERNRSAYEIAWCCDIPSPTVPEYVELHEGMTRVMEALKGQKKEP